MSDIIRRFVVNVKLLLICIFYYHILSYSLGSIFIKVYMVVFLFNFVIYLFLLLCLSNVIVFLCIFIVMYDLLFVFCFIVFCVLFVCKCVLYS